MASHTDPATGTDAEVAEGGAAADAPPDPYGLGWTADLGQPENTALLRMDVKRMWPLRLLHKVTFPVKYQERFYEQLYDQGHEFSWLAHFMDVLVGDCCCRVEPYRAEGAAKDSPPVGKRLYIMTLGVLEPYRHKGIGSHMLRAVMKDCWETQKVDHIALHVQCSNEKAQIFYKRFGFENKKKEEGYYLQLEDRDAFLLECKIPPNEAASASAEKKK